jgi:Tfp pilus assembly protein PilF
MVSTRHITQARRTGIAVAGCLTATSVFATGAVMQCATGPPEQRVETCTEILSRGPSETPSSRATTYSNRGRVYLLQGELDRAFADLNDTVRLDPENANAFAGRPLPATWGI